MANKKTPTKKGLISIKSNEAQNGIICDYIRLSVSSLEIQEFDHIDQIAFQLFGSVEWSTAYCMLTVDLYYSETNKRDIDDCYAIHLEFEIEGKFSTQDGLSSDELIQFVRMNSLSILWPYAREYASDQMKRTGIKAAILPIINPLETTEQLIEKNLFEIRYANKEGFFEEWKPSKRNI